MYGKLIVTTYLEKSGLCNVQVKAYKLFVVDCKENLEKNSRAWLFNH